MYKLRYRLSAFLLSAFVVFGTVSSQYLTVQAFDWVAPNVYLPFDGAIPYLMGLLGVAPKDNSLFTEEDYKEYLLQNGYTEEDLENENGKYADWVDDVCKGALNQASEYWTKFKAWIKSKSVANTIPFPLTMPVNSQTLKNYLNSNLGTNFQFTFDDNVEGFLYYIDSQGVYNLALFNSRWNDEYPVIKQDSNGDFVVYFGTTTSTSNVSILNVIDGVEGWTTTSNSFNLSADSIPFDRFFFSPNTVNLTNESFSILGDSSIANNLVVSLDPSVIDNLSFVLSDAISTAIPDVIPLPWDQIGDTVDEITDSIDGLIEQVNTGVLSISAYMQAILDLVGAIAVDTSTDLVYPQDPDKPDETIDDKTDANKDNMGFTLLGLEKVFPFCIPFDIYAFMTLLVAEPVAPVINWPVYNPITQDNEIITIDFSTWNSVVVLFRYIFDFLFIIGLLLMARALIGGGDSA